MESGEQRQVEQMPHQLTGGDQVEIPRYRKDNGYSEKRGGQFEGGDQSEEDSLEVAESYGAESYSASEIGLTHHRGSLVEQRPAKGEGSGQEYFHQLQRRGQRPNDLVINPDRFPTERIVNMLNLDNLELLQSQFESIVREDERRKERGGPTRVRVGASKAGMLNDEGREGKKIKFSLVGIDSLIQSEELLSKQRSTMVHSSRMPDQIDEEPDGLTIDQFVRVMLRILTWQPEDMELGPRDRVGDVSYSSREGGSQSVAESGRLLSTKLEAELGEQDPPGGLELVVAPRLSKVEKSHLKSGKPYETGQQASKIEHGTQDYFDLVFGLCQMFDEIDINGDGTMEWAELLQFLVDTVNVVNKMSADTNLELLHAKAEKEKQRLEDDKDQYQSGVSRITGASDFSFASDFSVVNKAEKQLKQQIIETQIEKFLLSKFNKFHQSNTVVDRIIHKSPVMQALYSSKFGKYIILEQDCPRLISIARQISSQNPELTDKEKKGLRQLNAVVSDGQAMADKIIQDYYLKPDFKKESFIMSMAFSQKHQILGATGSDGRIFFWVSKEKAFHLRPLFVIDASELTIQTRIWYLELHDVWVTVGKDNVLREWSLHSELALGLAAQERTVQAATAGQAGVKAKTYQPNARQKYLRLAQFKKRSLTTGGEEYFYNGFLVHQFKMHKDVVTDVIELANPLLIATACLDKQIRIISLREKRVIGHFQGHSRGVRQLDYTTFEDGFLVSVGFESFCNIWTFEGGMGSIQSAGNLARNSSNKANLRGRFNNYKHIIKVAKFLNNTPFCVEIDENNLCKIFNFLSMATVQIIQLQSTGPFEVNDLLMMQNLQRFAIVSKRLMFYDVYGVHNLQTTLQSGDPAQTSASKSPDTKVKMPEKSARIIGAEFNKASGNIVVVTTGEIRQYGGSTGSLTKILSDIQDERSKADIKSFAFDSRGRKIILGDGEGTVWQVNLQNGVVVMMLNNINDHQFEKRLAEGVESDKNREVTAIITESDFPRKVGLGLDCEEPEDIIVACSWNNKVKVYDQTVNLDSDDELDEPYSMDKHVEITDEVKAKKLERKLVSKKLDATALGDMIVCATVSRHHSLIVTASALGLVITWDLETAKILNVNRASQEKITFLSFMDKYPILIVGAADGVLSQWTTRTAPLEQRYQLVGQYKTTSIGAAGTPGALNLGISAGVAKVLQIEHRHKIFSSDTIEFSQSTLSQYAYTDEQQSLRAYEASQAAHQAKKPQKPHGRPSRLPADVLDAAAAQTQRGKVQQAVRRHVTVNEQNLTCKTGTYDRAITIIGTDAGYVQLWDLTYLTKPKLADSGPSDIREMEQQTWAGQRPGGTELYELDKASLAQFEEIKKPVHEQQLNYHALRRVNTKLDEHSARYLERKATEAAAAIREDRRKYPVLDALENIELRFYQHNAEALLPGLGASRGPPADRKEPGVPLQKPRPILLAPGLARQTSKRRDLPSSNSFALGGDPPVPQRDLSDQVPGDDLLDPPESALFRPERPQLARKFCRGILRVHDLAVTQIKLIEYNDRVHFLTMSDENKVKLFSLQPEPGGPILVQSLGVIDVFNSSSVKEAWRFPFDNAEVIKEQKQTLKEILREVQEAEAPPAEASNYRIEVLDTRKQQMDAANERKSLKKVQTEYQQRFVASQVTDMDRERVQKKFEAMKARKVESKLRTIAQAQAEQFLGTQSHEYIPVGKTRYKNEESRLPEAFEENKNRDLDLDSPTKLLLNQFDPLFHEERLKESTLFFGRPVRSKDNKSERGLTAARAEGQAQTRKDRQGLNKFLKDLLHQDLEEMPFTKREQILALGEKIAQTERTETPKRAFQYNKKTWYQGSPERVALNQLPVHHVGQPQIRKMAQSKQLARVIQVQQRNFQETIKDIKEGTEISFGSRERELGRTGTEQGEPPGFAELRKAQGRLQRSLKIVSRHRQGSALEPFPTQGSKDRSTDSGEARGDAKTSHQIPVQSSFDRTGPTSLDHDDQPGLRLKAPLRLAAARASSLPYLTPLTLANTHGPKSLAPLALSHRYQATEEGRSSPGIRRKKSVVQNDSRDGSPQRTRHGEGSGSAKRSPENLKSRKSIRASLSGHLGGDKGIELQEILPLDPLKVYTDFLKKAIGDTERLQAASKASRHDSLSLAGLSAGQVSKRKMRGGVAVSKLKAVVRFEIAAKRGLKTALDRKSPVAEQRGAQTQRAIPIKSQTTLETEIQLISDPLHRQRHLQPQRVHKCVDVILDKIHDKYKAGLRRTQIQNDLKTLKQYGGSAKSAREHFNIPQLAKQGTFITTKLAAPSWTARHYALKVRAGEKIDTEEVIKNVMGEPMAILAPGGALTRIQRAEDALKKQEGILPTSYKVKQFKNSTKN